MAEIRCPWWKLWKAHQNQAFLRFSEKAPNFKKILKQKMQISSKFIFLVSFIFSLWPRVSKKNADKVNGMQEAWRQWALGLSSSSMLNILNSKKASIAAQMYKLILPYPLFLSCFKKATHCGTWLHINYTIPLLAIVFKKTAHCGTGVYIKCTMSLLPAVFRRKRSISRQGYKLSIPYPFFSSCLKKNGPLRDRSAN